MSDVLILAAAGKFVFPDGSLATLPRSEQLTELDGANVGTPGEVAHEKYKDTDNFLVDETP
jgi:hypothetical protein